MERIYTIGFTKKTARQFFEMLKQHPIDLLLDIRLNNSSQLAGFSKGDDLRYFLEQICHMPYEHDLRFAPTPELLNQIRSSQSNWTDYETEYRRIVNERDAVSQFLTRYGARYSVCLLCSEAKATNCHRRLLAEMIQGSCPEIEIIHL